MVPGLEERGPKTLQVREQELPSQREEGVTGEGNPDLRAQTTVPTDGLKPVVPEPEGRDPKTLADDLDVSPRSRWGKWHQQKQANPQDMNSKERQQDVAEERRDLPNNINSQGPQGPQGPWFGRLRRQGPPTTAHNGREGHCGAAGQSEQRFRPGTNNLEPSQEGKKPVTDLKEQDEVTEGLID